MSAWGATLGKPLKPSEVTEEGDYLMRHIKFGEGMVRAFWQDGELWVIPTDGRPGPLSAPLSCYLDGPWSCQKLTAAAK